ncbi:MAG: hypothetical protein FWC00_01480 [Firmicutes bacterium]|nr:hypothetical protein [Bacillota bacterium]
MWKFLKWLLILKTVIVLVLGSLLIASHGTLWGLLDRKQSPTPKETPPYTEITEQAILQPLRMNMLSGVEFSAPRRPAYRDEGYIYNDRGNRLFVLEDVGIIVDENADVVVVQGESRPILYCDESEAFICSAGRSLNIWIDSMHRAILRGGTRQTISISLDNRVVLINVRYQNEYLLTYAFHTTSRRAWWDRAFNLARWGTGAYNHYFHDITGNRIPLNTISQRTDWSNVGSVLANIHPVLIGVRALFGHSPFLQMVDVLERTTLREKMQTLQNVQYHPFPRLRDPSINRYVRTSDGNYIFMSPRTNQFFSVDMLPLFSMTNRGLPLVFHENDIITTDLRPQEITNGVLVGVYTTHQLLMQGEEFYLGIITTSFGMFSVPIFYDDGRWNSATGDDITDEINSQQRHIIIDGESLIEWLYNIFGNGQLGLAISIIFWVVVALVLLFVIGLFTRAISFAFGDK